MNLTNMKIKRRAENLTKKHKAVEVVHIKSGEATYMVYSPPQPTPALRTPKQEDKE